MKKIKTYRDLFEQFKDRKPFLVTWCGKETILQVLGINKEQAVSFYFYNIDNRYEIFNDPLCDYSLDGPADHIKVIDWFEEKKTCDCDDYKIMLGFQGTCRP